MKWVRNFFLGGSRLCMVLATFVPAFSSFDNKGLNAGTSWFWAGWSLAFAWFVVIAVRRLSVLIDWANIRTFLFALSMVLLGFDIIRIRLDLFEEWFSSDPVSITVWLVRIFCGWSLTLFISLIKPHPRTLVADHDTDS